MKKGVITHVLVGSIIFLLGVGVMLGRAKTSADVELIIELYEKDKATLTAMLVNIREILLFNKDNDQAAIQKIKDYLKGQGVTV